MIFDSTGTFPFVLRLLLFLLLCCLVLFLGFCVHYSRTTWSESMSKIHTLRISPRVILKPQHKRLRPVVLCNSFSFFFLPLFNCFTELFPLRPLFRYTFFPLHKRVVSFTLHLRYIRFSITTEKSSFIIS